MSDKSQDEAEDDVADFDDFATEEVIDIKVDVSQDKKLNLERRRKIEEKIELYRLRDEVGFYDLEI